MSLSTPEMLRFAKRNKDLLERVKELGLKRRGSMQRVCFDAGVNYQWAKRFLAGRHKFVDITKICALYLALIGEDPAER